MNVESMTIHNEITGKTTEVWLDQKVYLTASGAEQGLGKVGDIAIVIDIIYNEDFEPGHPYESFVYLFRPDPHENWSDAEGQTDPEQGLVMMAENFTRYFTDQSNSRVVIGEDFEFRGKNLKGMRGRQLHKLNKDMFLELEEDVGGSSCDGMGKRGHCVLVPRKILVRPTKEKKSKKSK